MGKDPKKTENEQPARAAGEQPEPEPPAADASKAASQQNGQTPKLVEAEDASKSAARSAAVEPEGVKNFKVWLSYFRERPLLASAAFLLIVVGPIGGGWVLTHPAQTMKWTCANLGYPCPATAPIKKDTVAISTTLPRCWRGYLSFKLRNTQQSATWGPGTENLTICGNGEVSAEPGKLLEKFAARFSRCLVTTSDDGATTVSLNYASGAVCRAPYKPAQSDFVPSTLVGGINVCVPEAKNVANKDGQKFLAGKTNDTENWIYECDMTQLKQFEF